MLSRMLSDMMIKPGQSPVFGTPDEFGLEYESVEFGTADGITLRGWILPGSSERVIIQTHFGVQCSRSGYTPKGKGMIKLWKKDVSFLRQAKHLVDQGYTVLMYDMRNHGESDTGTCPWVSWGPYEALDVIAAVDFISHHSPYSNADIGLLSICMGAGASTYAFGMKQNGLANHPKIKSMVAVQPLHYKNFVKAFGIPAFLGRGGDTVSKARLGFDLNTKTFLDDVTKIDVPTLVVQNKNDPWTDISFVEKYYDKLTCEKEMLWQDLEKLRAGSYEELGRSPEFLSEFFNKHML